MLRSVNLAARSWSAAMDTFGGYLTPGVLCPDDDAEEEVEDEGGGRAVAPPAAALGDGAGGVLTPLVICTGPLAS